MLPENPESGDAYSSVRLFYHIMLDQEREVGTRDDLSRDFYTPNSY